MLVSAHLSRRSPIHDRDALSPKPPRDGGAIDRGISRTNDRNVAAHVQSAALQLAPLDVRESVHHVFFARYAESRRRAKTGRKKNSVKPGLQIRQNDVASHAN